MVNIWLRNVYISLLCSTLLLPIIAGAADLTAHVDKKELFSDEHVILTLALANSDTRLRAEGVSPNVDLSVLTADFDLGVPRVSHRFNINRNRGRSTSELVVELFPKHQGELRIPSFTIDGEQSTAIKLVVRKARPDKTPEVFIQSGISKNTVWVNEQVMVYSDLYHRVDLKSARLGGNIETDPLNITLIKLPQAGRIEQVEGIDYNVSRSAWMITPHASQTHRIFLPDVWVETADGRKIRHPIDEFTLQIKALPVSVPPLTLVGKPELTPFSFQSGPYIANRVLPWEISLRVDGGASNIPNQLPALDFPAQLKVYMNETVSRRDTTGNNTTSVVTYSGYIIPLQAGEFTLPEITLPYFDPERGVLDFAHIQSQTLTVEPAPVSASSANPAQLSAPFLDTSGNGTSSNVWKITSGVFAMLWLATLLIGWMMQSNKRDRKKTPDMHVTTGTNNSLSTRLAAALGGTTQVRTLEQGLAVWEGRYGENPELRSIVHAVQQHCYGHHKADDPAALESKVENMIKKLHTDSYKALQKNGEEDPWSPRSFTTHRNI